MKFIAVSSGKGGTGKSCVTAYTGAALSKRGQRVLIVELGGSSRSADLILGSSNTILFDFLDCVAGRCDLQKAIVQTDYDSNLYILPGPPLGIPISLEQPWLDRFLEQIGQEFDFVLFDSVDYHIFPPAIVDTILLVITPESLAIRSTAMHARAVFEAGAKEVRLVINNVSAEVMPMYGARDFDDVIDTIGAQLIGVIPHSPILQYSSNNAQSLEDASLTAHVFANIAARLMGEHPLLLIK